MVNGFNLRMKSFFNYTSISANKCVIDIRMEFFFVGSIECEMVAKIFAKVSIKSFVFLCFHLILFNNSLFSSILGFSLSLPLF